MGAVNLDLLPKPKFTKVTDKQKKKPTRRSSRHQDDIDETRPAEPETAPAEPFQRPNNHYLRHVEPTEQELFDMVEYDMDEQDEIWLDMLNAERKQENLGQVPCSLFENIIDKLEKEWFDLVKQLPKHTEEETASPEDSACAICDDGECENSNAIVFCDGCNLAVHQDCYGVPYIPEGQWLCRKCMVSPDKPVSCVFCPNEGGAFKQTNTNKWGHLLCAIWIPEVGVSNSVYMEPIDNIEAVPKSRWKLTCYICKKRHGACIQCDNKHCFTAFHVTCARWARLCMRMKSLGSHYDSVVLKAYCDKHTPREYREEVDVERCVYAAQRLLDPKAARNRDRAANGTLIPRRRHVDEFLQDHHTPASAMAFATSSSYNGDHDDDDDDAYDSNTDARDQKSGRKSHKKQHSHPQQSLTPLSPSVKAARAHQHHYSAGAPIAPDYILNRLEAICFRHYSYLRKKPQLLATICRYWSLKREARRGAPLLKRLHLEPWTASSSQMKQTEVEKAHRANAIMTLRSDLERIRLLSEQVQKREKQKLERLRRQKEYIEMVLYPVEYVVKQVINELIDMDKKELFLHPVTPDIAPDYFQIITQPMSFMDIIRKFHAHDYTSLDDVEKDLSLIWANSMTYNRSETTYYKLAQRMKEHAQELMAKAR
ncbi:PHD-zinc-finger like domain-containing protein, partial [Gongronella butleri]